MSLQEQYAMQTGKIATIILPSGTYAHYTDDYVQWLEQTVQDALGVMDYLEDGLHKISLERKGK
jgi:hypothetical protein